MPSKAVLAFLIALCASSLAFTPLPEPETDGITSTEFLHTVDSSTVEGTLFYNANSNPDGLILWLSDPFVDDEELETEFAMSLARQGHPVAITTFRNFTNSASFDETLQENLDALVETVESAKSAAVEGLPFLVDKVCVAGVGRSGSVALLLTRQQLKDVVGIISVSPTSLSGSGVINFDGFVALYHGDRSQDVSSADIFAFEDELRQANVFYEVTRYSNAESSILNNNVAWSRAQASIVTFIEVVFRPEELEYITQLMFMTNIEEGSFQSQFLEYQDGGESFRGYIAFPSENSSQPLSAVVIAPDWDGVSEYEIWRAKLLAQMGYVALVADIYGAKVEQGPTLPFARRVELTRRFSGSAFIPRALAAIKAVTETDLVKVNEDNIALIGYCFGGSGSLEIAKIKVPGLRGVAAFHPGTLLTTGDSNLDCYETSTLILSGADDPSIDTEEINQFREDLNNKASIWEFTNYGLARHSFTEPQVPRDGEFAAYSPFADVRSFSSLENFLLEIFTPHNENIYMHCG